MTQKIARIHEGLTGLYYISDDSSDTLDERGRGHRSRQKALSSLKNDLEGLGFTHYLDSKSRIKAL